jgi:ribonuclease BN (tRNA processing enzyme)
VTKLWVLGVVAAAAAAGQQPSAPPSRTRVVLLGTGNPAADPDRSGPATAIVVNDTPYLVDFGPGVVRRAKAAVIERGVTALEPTNLRVAFVTHLHSDHTVGYPDLIFSPWTLGRRVPLDVYGPPGLAAMTSHLLEAYRVDIATRTNADGNQHDFPDGHKVNAREIRPGVVYKDANVTVTAFPTKHAMESYGYRFETADRSIVISGDTNPTQATIDACRGCDVLIHEVNTLESLARRDARFQAFAAKYHTSTEQLAELAAKAAPARALPPLDHAASGHRADVLDPRRAAARDERPLLRTVRDRPRPGHLVSGSGPNQGVGPDAASAAACARASPGLPHFS